jgi:hypothetical protein
MEEKQTTRSRSLLGEFFEYKPIKTPPRKYTRLTPSARSVLAYYIALSKSSGSVKFCRSLRTISTATGIPVRTISTANECMYQLGLLDWIRGHGSLGGYDTPNRYTLIDGAADGSRSGGQVVSRPGGKGVRVQEIAHSAIS